MSAQIPVNQHRIASGLVAAIGLWIAYISFTAQPAEAYLFPRLIAVVFAILAVWTFLKACMGKTKVGNGLSAAHIKHLLPGLIVACIYVFWAAKALGFYTSTGIACFILLALYDPAPHNQIISWFRRLLVAACFVAVMYLLFALLLKVFTPREILF